MPAMIFLDNTRSLFRIAPEPIFFSAGIRAALFAIALATVTGYAAAQSEKPLTYVDILHQLTDLDRLTHLQTGCKAGLFSSWDRNSRTVWGANGDAGQYLRIEPNGEAVMMDIDGPGVIYRTWSANPMGKLRIYLDGARTPSYEWNFPDLFDGELPPFIKPLVFRRDSPQAASDCYLPIPFAKHIKIAADNPHGEYYHFNYVLLLTVPRRSGTRRSERPPSPSSAASNTPAATIRPASPPQCTTIRTPSRTSTPTTCEPTDWALPSRSRPTCSWPTQ